jgi:CzcA family heavy metal efflux pump
VRITRVALHQRTTVLVLAAFVVIAGLYSYVTLPRESAPDVRVPIITISTTQQGVSPSDMETGVTQPLERKLKGLAGVRKMSSMTVEGTSIIVIEFEAEEDVDDALRRTKDKVDQALGDLPADADAPIVNEINFSEFPIMILNISGTVGLSKLKEMADDLEEKLETIRGVLAVEVVGGLEREIHVEVDATRLAAYNIPVNRILGFLEAENRNVTGGTIDVAQGKYQVRIAGEFESLDEIDNLVIWVVDGRPVYLSDIGTVIDGYEDRKTYARINGRPSVSLLVQKRSGENVIRVAREVKDLVAAEARTWPQGSRYAVTFDQTRMVKMLVADLENNILSGLILVVAVLFIVMGWRNAIFVASAIPFSMLISFAVLRALGFTLNMVVLFSLVLALGMLVDNAIVVVENSYRHLEQGFDRLRAVEQGTAEIAWPVTTSTLTTLCAFLPMVFWPGIVGKFMGFLPKTVIITLAASLFVALVFNPVWCSLWMHRARRRPRRRKRERPHPILHLYGGLLDLGLKRPLVTVALAVAALLVSGGLFARFGAGVEFFPETEPDRAYIDIVAPDAVNIEESNRIVRKVENALAPFDRDIQYVITSVGSMGQGKLTLGGEAGSTPNKSRVSLEFVDREERTRPSSQVVEEIRAALDDFPGADVRVEKEESGPPTGPPINIEISGDDYDRLAELAAQVKKRLEDMKAAINVRDDLERGQPELRIKVDRQRAPLLGLTSDMVATMAKIAINGIKVGVFRVGEDEYDIRARFRAQDRNDLNVLRTLMISNLQNRLVPLSSVASVNYVSGLTAIRRMNHRRTVTVSAEVPTGYNAIAVRQAAARQVDELWRKALVRHYNVTFTGQQEEEEKARAFLSRAFVAALFLILMVLVSQFNSIRLPVIIMASVILSLIGVFVGLLATGLPFGIIMTGIGVISLAGVVVNNAIVLVDFIVQLRRKGWTRDEALREASRVRLRPVLLTAVTTILGLTPMAVGVSLDFRTLGKAVAARLPGLAGRLDKVPRLREALELDSQSSEWWSPMAVAVIFGLAVATLLTLVVVPALYKLLTRPDQPRPEDTPVPELSAPESPSETPNL